MIHLKDMKSLLHHKQDNKTDAILSIVVTLISGMVILLSISPEYLRELNPFTLLLLSIAAALPVWAFNQLLWWYFGRKVSATLVGKATGIFAVSEKSKKIISFALSQLMTALDVMRFIPVRKIASLLTILTIYIGSVVSYFTFNSPAVLYGTIFSLSFIIWLIGLFVLHRSCRKFDERSLKEAWSQLKNNEELVAKINSYFERIELIVQSELHVFEKFKTTTTAESPGKDG